MNTKGADRSIVELGFTLVPCCVSKLPRVQTGTRVLHEEIEIKFFYEGSSTLLIGDRAVSVQAGDVVVINPYEFHTTVDCGGACTGKYHIFMVPLDYFSKLGQGDLQLRSRLLTNNQSFCTLFSRHTALSHLLEQIVQEYTQKTTAYAARICALLTEAFVLLLREGLQEENSTNKNDHLRHYRLIEPALRQIRDRYSEPINVDQLAALCNLSKHYFCHVFKEVMGQSAMEYLQTHRLKIADILLRNSDQPIFSVAETCGFESAAYFCRLYKKRYGIPPSLRR